MSNDRIQITVAQQGAAEAAAALQGVEKATAAVTDAASQSTAGATGAARAQQALAQETQRGAQQQVDFGRKAAGSAQVLEGVKMAAQGGASALFGVGRALDGLLTVVGLGGPWGKLLTTLAAVTSAMVVMRDATRTTGDEGESSAEKFKKAWDEASAALTARREETFSAQIEAIKRRADEATESVNRLMAARDRMANADMGAEIEAISSNLAYTPEERRVLELQVRQRYARAAEDRRFGAIEEPVRAAARKEQELEATVTDRRNALNRTREDIATPDRERARANAEIERLSAELLKEGDTVRRAQLEGKIQDAMDRKASFEVDPEWAKRKNEQALDQQNALRAAEKELERARQERRQAEEVAATERETQTRERDANERARKSSMGAAEAARASRVAAGQATPDDPMDTAGQRAVPANASAIPSAVEALRASMPHFATGATEAELVAVLREIADLFRQSTSAATKTELLQIGEEVKRLRAQMAASRNR